MKKITEKHIEQFKTKKYIKFENVLDKKILSVAKNYYDIKFNKIKEYHVTTLSDDVVGPYNNNFYADPLSESLLYELLPFYKKLSGKDLIPTYSFARLYKKGQFLNSHIDRPACQFSLTLCIYSNLKNPWPIFIEDEGCSTSSNEAVFYKGCELNHYRNTLNEDASIVQLHLHYVDKNDDFYNKFVFDGRPGIGMPYNSVNLNERYRDYISENGEWLTKELYEKKKLQSL